MYLRWSQLHAEPNLQHASVTLSSYSARYKLSPSTWEIRKRTTGPRLFRNEAVQPSTKEARLIRKVRQSIDWKPCATRLPQGSVGGDGSWNSRESHFHKKVGITFSRGPFQRAFATNAALRGTAFGRTMREMGRAGASREKFHFQFITTPTSDTVGTTLLLHFDNKRYIFGDVSEGTPRACAF